MTKQELRKIVRASKKEISLNDKIQRSKAVMQKVETHPDFVAAKTVLLYWSMDDEVYTHDFVRRWYHDKNILLPCVDGDNLLLRRYTGADSMVPGPQFGIPEPVGPIFDEVNLIDMIVVPGVAFDKQRNRMGRGRGFYDRLLKTTSRAVKVGVAFDFQVFDAIPVEPFDVAMSAVIAETHTY